MKKRKHTLSLIGLLLIGAFAACKKVLKVDLRDAPSRIVIEGEVTNLPGPYQVKITKTVAFSASNDFPPVKGATVTITDSINGHIYLLTETAPGIYTTNDFSGIPKHTYQLLVNAEGQQYTASSTMPGTIHLDSVSFAANTDFNGKKELNAVVYYQDPPGLGNYYQFMEYLNGKEIPNIFVFEDRLSDGRYIQQPLYNDSTYLQKGDTLALKMYCIDKGVYNYFFSLAAISSANGGFQSASPANPNTNLTGGALGYFSAHTINEEKIEVY